MNSKPWYFCLGLSIVEKPLKDINFFKNEDVSINVKPETKLINVIKKISSKIKIPFEKLYINYNDKTLTEKDYEATVKQFFGFPKNKSRPILYVKLKSLVSGLLILK